ncbi:MAG: type II CRISPR RNA-guided endonuclease Cas9 [Cytophagales bacterium]|nr:type II CRISPR RNA-guided endonuclease Cas9 [Cytophagales bacterium]
MTKILGLDLGTNSIGWAVVGTENNRTFKLLEKGVHIFQEGVKIEKGIEGSKAAERTEHRSARRLKFRRKLRKYHTLNVLIEYDMCPLDIKELKRWRNFNNPESGKNETFKHYPKSKTFLDWQMTRDEKNGEKKVNPYYYRHLAASKKLDLDNQMNRYLLGRAFYHMGQRRGFLSNRLDTTKESDGIVKQAIDEISKHIKERTLGQYFYEKYLIGEKIRNQYTHREVHYLKEFETVCKVQQLSDELVKSLKKAIFYQRPLKSQKSLVGKCPFERNKPRCAVSHPDFEEYRMLCFVNNIKIKTPEDEKLRQLNEDERKKVIQRFYLKRDHFDFEDLAKQLAPNKQYRFYKDRNKSQEDCLFNYDMKTTVSGCPVSARFRSTFGEGWKDLKLKYSREKDNKVSNIDIHDVWHVLFTFDSEQKLKEFAQHRLGLNEIQTEEFLSIKLKRDYASLSLKAIHNILPYLGEGLIYSHAVFLAKMKDIIPEETWEKESNRKIIREEIKHLIQSQNQERQIIEIVNGLIKTCRENNWNWSAEGEQGFRDDLMARLREFFGENKWSSIHGDEQTKITDDAFGLFKSQMKKGNGRGEFIVVRRVDERIKDFITDHFNVSAEQLKNLYHPSDLDLYKPPVKGDDGREYLGSPMVSSVRNPMAMRSLHQLRSLINELIRQDIIDASTKIHIEMARDLKNANERKALQSWQRDRESKRREFSVRIMDHFNKAGINNDPSEEDILKYQLWEEQNHKCIYTGKEINISDFLGSNPSYDIEHTIPRSLSFDNSQENKTLCENRFNREIKKNKIPYELANHAEILERIEHWRERFLELEKQISAQVKKSKGASTRDIKDRAIQRRHQLIIECNYWKEKYRRFEMKDVPEGFKNSQLVDTGIITRYARLYLKTLFDKVYTVKGNTVADFRKHWGLQDEYVKKERINHIHHCIDAITIACITKQSYEFLAKSYHDSEDCFTKGSDKKIKMAQPWESFAYDVRKVEQEVLVSHHTPDVLPKQSKKKLRKRGKIKYNKKALPFINRVTL